MKEMTMSDVMGLGWDDALNVWIEEQIGEDDE
jgi:hypothetical protein